MTIISTPSVDTPSAAQSLPSPESSGLSESSGLGDSSELGDSSGLGPLDSHQPLVAREDLDRRISHLVPCAVQRQLWLIMLDADDVQLPVMIPIGDLPLRGPEADGEGVVESLRSLAVEFGAVSFVFIVERPGAAALREGDRHWVTFLFGLPGGDDFRVRAVYVCHDDGNVGYDARDAAELGARAKEHAGVEREG